MSAAEKIAKLTTEAIEGAIATAIEEKDLQAVPPLLAVLAMKDARRAEEIRAVITAGLVLARENPAEVVE